VTHIRTVPDFFPTVFFAAPARPAGTCDVQFTNRAGLTRTGVLTYIDFPANGLESPVERVSVGQYTQASRGFE
jgi:hypothetical protein